jgi:hypothetical protein
VPITPNNAVGGGIPRDGGVLLQRLQFKSNKMRFLTIGLLFFPSSFDYRVGWRIRRLNRQRAFDKEGDNVSANDMERGLWFSACPLSIPDHYF